MTVLISLIFHSHCVSIDRFEPKFPDAALFINGRFAHHITELIQIQLEHNFRLRGVLRAR